MLTIKKTNVLLVTTEENEQLLVVIKKFEDERLALDKILKQTKNNKYSINDDTKKGNFKMND